MKKLSDMLRALGAVAALGTLTSTAAAQQVIRTQIDVEGDFKLIGNTLAYECSQIPGNPNTPVVGTVAGGACTQSNTSDQGPDLFWISDNPADGQATADISFTADQSRSTAWLNVDPTQSVIYARLYWAARSPDGSPDDSVVLDRPNAFSEILDADVQHTPSAGSPVATLGTYESSADVTDIVQTWGTGAYRVGGASSVELPNADVGASFAAWSLVVFYAEDGQPLRQLTLFDGLSPDGSTINISGFLVPQNPVDTKFGVVAYNGDGQTGGDSLEFNGFAVDDGASGNDFFNGSKTNQGLLVSNVGDLPQLTGDSGSHPGVDIDIIGIAAASGWINAGDTTANIVAKAGGDGNVLIGAVVTSIPTFKPNFNESVKTATDVNGGSLVAGDVLRYTIDVVNTGNDPAVGVTLEDALPTGVTYVADSIVVVNGPNAGAKTDVTGDDEGEYDGASRTVTLRLGTGADAVNGGWMDIGESITVQFDVTVDTDAVGSIANQATIVASGEQGAPETTFTSTDPVVPGPTTVVVDECVDDADCPAGRPLCLIAVVDTEPNVCVDCKLN
jgi:uncharacterized repeat protein (TIGR01451 family)